MGQRARAAIAMSIAMVGLTACGGTASQDVVARVGDATISAATLDRWTSLRAGAQEGADAPDRSARLQALALLISSRWLIAEAAREGTPVSRREVEQRLAARVAAYANGKREFREVLKVRGQTEADAILEIEAELASSKIDRMLAAHEPAISAAQVAAYYSRNRQSFVLPEERQVVITSTESRAATERLVREVQSGRNLAAVAGRKLLVYTRHPPRNALERAIYSAERGLVTGPIEVGPNYFVFEVRHIVPARQRTLAEVRRQIEARLGDEQRRRSLARFVEAWEARWVPRTNCSPGFVIRKCRQFPDRSDVPEIPASLQ